MNDDVNFQSIRTDQLARELEEQFIEYVLSEASERAHEGPLTTDGIADAFQQMERNGYRIHDDEWNAQVMGFVSGEAYDHLSDDVHRAPNYQPVTATNSVVVHDVPIRVAPVLPDNTCVLIHHDAVIPSSTLSMKRPWLVRDEHGVIAIWSEGE